MQRQAIQPAAFCTNMMPKMAGVVTQSRNVTARAQHVANDTGAEARDDVGGDREDVARADLRLGQVERGLLLHVHHQRRSGEHGEEGGEEAPPRHVEGAGVRVAVVEDDELDRLVLGVHRHGEDAAEDILLTTAVHALLLEGSVQLVNVVLERLDGRLELLQLLSGSHGRLRGAVCWGLR